MRRFLRILLFGWWLPIFLFIFCYTFVWLFDGIEVAEEAFKFSINDIFRKDN